MEKLKDLTIPKDFNLKITGMTQSLLNTFLTCRVKFLLSVNRYYIPSTSKALHFGNLIHKMLEEYYTKSKYNIDKFTDKEIRIDAQEIERQKAVAEPILKIYKAIYSKDKFQSIEQIFAVKFRGYLLRLKVDGLTISNDYVIDHKTSGRINEEDLLDKLSFDGQSLFYITALEAADDRQLKGAFNNVIRRPGHKQGDLSLKDFQKKIEKEILKDPDHFYKRFKIPFTKGEKKTYADELEKKLNDVQMVIDTGNSHIYKNETQCIGSWGACKFIKVCSSGNLTLCKRRKKIFPELNL